MSLGNVSKESKEVFLDPSCEADIAIIGAGVAGMYAAYCCSLSNLSCVLIDELTTAGGQCMALYSEKLVYGIPGYIDVKAKDYIAKLSEQCLGRAQKEFFGYKVTNLNRTNEGKFLLNACNVATCTRTRQCIRLRAQYVIIATGIGEMKPNIPTSIEGIDKISKGSDFIQVYCLNHTLYRGKNVIVAGGGDSAVDFAIDISSVAKQVTIIHRRANFACESNKIDKLQMLVDAGKIKLAMEQNIQKLSEENGNRIVYTKNGSQNEQKYRTDHIVFCYGFVVSLGTLATDLGLETEKNLIKVNIDNMETSAKGCYAIGDVVTYTNKKKNIIPCFFEADRAVRAIKSQMTGG